jgi:LysR family transcriptional activator of nhaA
MNSQGIRADWLNFQHLFYFWTIAREGGLSRAGERLRITHSTLSVQLRTLEEFLGAPLFERRGRRLVLTPFGAEVAAHASEIFRLGAELVDVARGTLEPGRTAFRVGAVSSLPKSLTYRLLEPALGAGSGPLQVIQDDLGRLLEALASHRLHLVLSDVPPADGLALRVHAHVLGESEILLYGTKALAARYRKGFPQSLERAPFVLPRETSNLRKLIDRWLAERGIRVRMEAEIDDAALLRVVGAAGRGLFPVRAALRAEVEEAHGAAFVGKLAGVRERVFAISAERRVRHPAVAAIIVHARQRLR